MIEYPNNIIVNTIYRDFKFQKNTRQKVITGLSIVLCVTNYLIQLNP